MTPALWGLMTALSWGGADFIARFTGRAVGHHMALFGMLLASAVLFSGIFLLTETPFVWATEGLAVLALSGLGAMVATLLLYWGLARGPVTIVAPLAASYPLINVAYALAQGRVPTLLQGAAMAAVMAGAVVVARCVSHFEDAEEYGAEQLRKTVLIALGAALAFGVTVICLQEAGRIYGDLQAVFMTRWVSLAASVGVLRWRREKVSLPLVWWPLVIFQGVLDGAAFLGLSLGGQSAGGEIAAVVASTFSAVTIVLARIFLKERMRLAQVLGTVMILVGVAALLMP